MHFAHPHNFSKGPRLTDNNYITVELYFFQSINILPTQDTARV